MCIPRTIISHKGKVFRLVVDEEERTFYVVLVTLKKPLYTNLPDLKARCLTLLLKILSNLNTNEIALEEKNCSRKYEKTTKFG